MIGFLLWFKNQINHICKQGGDFLHYQTILFDLDGTLTDSFEGITKCVRYALESMGISVSCLEELSCFIGPPLRVSFAEFYQMNEHQIEQAIAKYRERFREVGIYENALYQGVVEMIQKLHQNGLTLCIASSKPRIFIERILTHFGLDSYFQIVVGSELDGTLDEKSQVIQAAIERSYAQPDTTVMVGDRKFDAQGAMENQIDFIGACYGFGREKELCDYPHVFLAQTPLEIADFLLK